jgi:hypothetical protein
MTDIQRQRDEAGREAVLFAIRGDVKATISRLGTHKDPAPDDFPNRQVVNAAAELNQDGTVVPDREPPTGVQGNQVSCQPLLARASRIPTTTAKRYTLVLKLDGALHHHLEASLERQGAKARPAAKRAMLLAFRSQLTVIDLTAVPAAAPIDAVSYRIDIRLSEPQVRQLLAAVGQNAFEPKATALARSLAPRFAAFVRDALASNSESVDISSTIETTAGAVQAPV